MVDALVVGAGFSGAVVAERLASVSGLRVLVIDKREHIGGNAFDETDPSGLVIHRYGPHIFHTNADQIVEHLSRFTEWRPYEHRVLARVQGQLLPIPINRTTINRLYGLDLTTEEEAQSFLESRAEPREKRTSEDVVLSTVGRELYELFFRGYTRKQWGLDPSQLDASVTARIPTRTNEDDRYFTDSFQSMPRDGYTAMFRRMLDHPNITVSLGTDFHEVRQRIPHRLLVYTGPVDAFFDYRYGPLPYRSLRFDFETLDTEQFQPVGTVNEPDEAVPYTRTTEFKHLTGQRSDATTIVREYPMAEGDPYYPIPRPENAERYAKYEALAEQIPNTWFVGRLATYKYYNMDQCVGQALATYKKIADQLHARPFELTTPLGALSAVPKPAPTRAAAAGTTAVKSPSTRATGSTAASRRTATAETTTTTRGSVD
jgi:UDP-galactopyranose mutase